MTTGIRLGIQLYTVREDLAKDFRGTLAALAKMGYQGVEFAWNYGDMTPDELSAFLKGLGLVCCGLHAKRQDYCDASSSAYTYAKGLGSPFLTTSCAGEVAKDWKATIASIAKAGDTAKKAGLRFTYHHHAQEFALIDGIYALDLLLQSTDPKAVMVELDTYWIKKGGEAPVPYIRKYAGRVPQLHIKDMDKTDGSTCPLGTGLIDLPGVFAAAREIGTEWVIYEQDNHKGPSLESARISAENLKRAKLV